eukprot:12139547-Prorocentrum_lima.AAC.1
MALADPWKKVPAKTTQQCTDNDSSHSKYLSKNQEHSDASWSKSGVWTGGCQWSKSQGYCCLLYTSDAADDM